MKTPTPMSPEAMRVAIATLEGFTNIRTERQYEETGGADGYDGWFDVLVGDTNGEDRKVPDYLNDLNACHAFEDTLTEEESLHYGEALHKILACGFELDEDTQISGFSISRIARATATQKCEAFLRAKGLYVEGGK
jgi:hypothetical protein